MAGIIVFILSEVWRASAWGALTAEGALTDLAIAAGVAALFRLRKKRRPEVDPVDPCLQLRGDTEVIERGADPERVGGEEFLEHRCIARRLELIRSVSAACEKCGSSCAARSRYVTRASGRLAVRRATISCVRSRVAEAEP